MSNAPKTDARQERGLALYQAKKPAIRHIVGGKYLVPSAGGGKDYVVDAEERRCSCPDHEERAVRCKHMWAVSYFREETTLPDGSTVVTETAKVVRLTYKQDWPAYNRAQCEEKDRVQILLAALCEGIQEPPRGKGRPRLPLRDTVFGATMKVYGLMSGRRSTSDIRACAEDGHTETAPSYNTLFRLVDRPDVKPLLERLVEESAKPLRAIESTFAVDSTGFSSITYTRWFDHKWGGEKRYQRWVKLHASVGTVTNIVTAARVTPSTVGDSPMLPELVEATAANGFPVDEVSADKAYLSHANLATIMAAGAIPFIPFKENSGSEGSEAWARMWHHFSANKADFLAHYHRRSNVETAFSSIKRKFGGAVRSKLPAAQLNEVLLKCLCHNLSCLVHAIHELGVEPKFWLPASVTP